MEDKDTLQDTIEVDDKLYGKTIKTEPKPEPQIGLENEHSIINDILDTADSSLIDTSVLNSFIDVSRNRDNVYKLVDQMCQDPIPAAILELFTEDTTATNDNKEIVWVTSDDAKIQKTANLYLKAFQVNKNIYKWANSLIKYGDVYLKLFKQSEYNTDPIFGKKKNLNEDINLHINKEDDHFVNYAEMVDNPATVFELTRFGKTAGFIKTHINNDSLINPSKLSMNSYIYTFNQNDVEVYQQDQFVHGSLEDNVDRVSEEVEIIRQDPNKPKNDIKVKYKVKSGQSAFANAFKIWREMSLLENSLILSRVTKSSITRVIQVEVGNVAKEESKPILQSVKQLIEQKAAVNPGQGMSEYNNPGPMENNIYMATKDGKGAITTSQIGGDYDPKQLTDIDFFKNQFYGAFGIPKQFFGDTDDGAGFNGGQSLTIISSKYAKKVVKIQTALCQMLTSLLNILFIDRNLPTYVNKFTVNMLAPITQEELDRREANRNQLGTISDTMNLFSDIDDPLVKLKLTKALVGNLLNNAEALQIVQDQIDKLEVEPKQKRKEEKSPQEKTEQEQDNQPLDLDRDLGLTGEEPELEIETAEQSETAEQPEESQQNQPGTENNVLPTPGETGVDLINNTEEI